MRDVRKNPYKYLPKHVGNMLDQSVIMKGIMNCEELTVNQRNVARRRVRMKFVELLNDRWPYTSLEIFANKHTIYTVFVFGNEYDYWMNILETVWPHWHDLERSNASS